MDKQILLLASKMLDMAGDKFGDNTCNDLNEEVKILMTDKEKLLKQYNIHQNDKDEELDSIEDVRDWVLMFFLSEKLEEFAKSL